MTKNLISGPSARRRALQVTCAAAGVAIVAALAATVGTARADGPGPAAAPSPGCSSQAPAPGESTPAFAAAGESGSYIQDVPAGATRPLPVVLDLHGVLETSDIQHAVAGLGEFGDSHGFVTITPQLNEPGFSRWDFGENSADVNFLSQLLTHVESTLCADQRRVYVTGMSMGALTTSSLACQLSDRIAAIAPVAGLEDFAWCHPTRRVPIVAFHGTADPLIGYNGDTSQSGRDLKLLLGPTIQGPSPQSIPSNAAAWARRNGCGSTPAQKQIAPDVVLQTYPCAADGTVELYSIIGGGHSWPGTTSTLYPAALVGRTTTSISATQIMWNFFQAHPLPR